MELLILIILLVVLAEVSYLVFFKNRTHRNNQNKIYVDTSVLIDRRILDIVRTGFLSGSELIILQSVLRELQLLADGKDMTRRARARDGLEAASELERIVGIDTKIVRDIDSDQHVKVDEQLLKYAQKNHSILMTLDFNLIKVAEAEKIPTLNINELSIALRTDFVQGEIVQVRITDKGANPGQGIAHLSNGTMVIVEDGASHVGSEVSVKLIKFHETPSGRMIFAKIVPTKHQY